MTLFKEEPPALSAEFIISAASAHQFPEPRYPEVALLGRSNAGKSSLLNRWLGRKALAKVSSTPGRTRQINFFEVLWRKGFLPFYLTDLPGYGFAAAPKNMVASWQRLISDYLDSARPIKLALLIMDIRRNPADEEANLLSWLHGLNIAVCPIASKADKLKSAERTRQLEKIKAFCTLHNPKCLAPLAFSSLTGLGRDKLISILIDSGILNPDNEAE